MQHLLSKPNSKEDYQTWLVAFTIVFVVFVKCYMMWLQPQGQSAYQKDQQKIETQSQVLWEYPNIEIPLMGK